ncbi:hypothetical protein ISP17_11400 [Dyella ginsengisoli]|uniref:Uncharacterized protein n=1 Tax=Dyella ginsengisoli TaxID=363848 RepID=A0ABW8JTY6_9GAMM
MGNPIVTTTSRSWQQITNLAAVLQGISLANGYLTDVGQNIWTTDNQRTDENALGIMLYSGDITSSPAERPAKAEREIEIYAEVAIATDQDDAHQQIHSVIEDVERCVTTYAKAQFAQPSVPTTPLRVGSIKILDRPEGASVIVAVITVLARYFR